MEHVPLLPEDTIYSKWERQGVEFIPHGDRPGGQIRNSYKITDPDEMYQYALYLKTYTDCFAGSVEGIVFEWEIHNEIYYSVDESSSWYTKAKHVDLGATIYHDKHDLFGITNLASIAMWSLYAEVYPEQAKNDWLIYQNYSGG